jgi:hypothetical protein
VCSATCFFQDHVSLRRHMYVFFPSIYSHVPS